MSKAVARLRGRDYTVPGDVREVFQLTVAHRLSLTSGAEHTQTAEQILRSILESTPSPRLR
jgi:MoxR-like ATPase